MHMLLKRKYKKLFAKKVKHTLVSITINLHLSLVEIPKKVYGPPNVLYLESKRHCELLTKTII
jgi:hypothetical protein